MAEAHPVGFQWVMEAKARGATIIHVDPRFSRTSAVADLHVPIRAGADIAFVGGLINYVLSNEKYFREYVVAYTNAAGDPHRGFPGHRGPGRPVLRIRPGAPHLRLGDLAVPGRRGLAPASGARGMQPGQHRELREASRGEAHGSGGAAAHPAPDTRRDAAAPPLRVPGPQAALRPLHAGDGRARWPACPPEQFLEVARLITENSGRDRTTAFVYSLGWTQHTVGVQYIRTAAILQPLLGNMGRPGGGILALRGHATIQGSTDIPTLFDLLPGYLPMPFAHHGRHRRPGQLRRGRAGGQGLLGQHRRLHGQPAEGVVGRRGHRGQRLLLRLPAPADRRPQHLHDGHGADRGRLPGLLPVRAEPGGRLGQRPDAADGPGQPGLAGGPGPGR